MSLSTPHAFAALVRQTDLVELLAFAPEPLSPDRLAERLSKTSSEIAAGLTLLCRVGVLTIAPGGRFALDLDAVDAIFDSFATRPALVAA